MCKLGSTIYHTKLKHAFVSGTDPRASLDEYEDLEERIVPEVMRPDFDEEVTVRV